MPEVASTIRLGKPTTPQTPPCDLWPGDVLARRYRLDTLLGWGGQAVVFQATDLRAAKRNGHGPVAVKLVRTDLPPAEYQEAVSVLRWEAKLLRQLQHSALPRLINFHTSGNMVWLVRDYFAGTSLAELVTQVQCSARQVQQWAIQLCDLLQYMHTQSPPIICGDIKPSNLVLRADGSIAFIDLGAAMTYTQRRSSQSRPRHGTPGYAAPEQLGKRDVDERTDLFSLGVTCYELLTGDDPTVAPLQFDLDRLRRTTPLLAPAVRWAITLDQTRRPPTAAAFRSELTAPTSPDPLRLDRSVRIVNQYDLMRSATRQPKLVNEGLASGAIDSWLAIHPDRVMGNLLHNLRTTRRHVAPHERPLDVFFRTLAPQEGSAFVRAKPHRLQFGRIPLRHWRVWSTPQQLTIHNASTHPQCWELECPSQKSGEVRIVINGRLLRRYAGVLPPEGRVEVALIAAGRTGKQHGQIALRCGKYVTLIDWEAVAMATLPLGQQLVTYLKEIDVRQPDLVPLLEDLLVKGVLQRWLRAQGERRLAAALSIAAKQPSPDATTLRLLTGRVLHHLEPKRFPLVSIHSYAETDLQVAVRESIQHTLEIENMSDYAYPLKWSSMCPWISIKPGAKVVPPQEVLPCIIKIVPPVSLPLGPHRVALNLSIGDLHVPMNLVVHVTSEGWWSKMFRWFIG